MVAAITPFLRATGARYARPGHAVLITCLVALPATAAITAATLLGRPVLAVAVLPTVAAIPLLLMRHRLALGAMVVLETLNLSLILAGYGVPKVHLLLLGVAAVSIFARWLVQRTRPRVTIVMWFALAYVAARAASLLAAPDPAAGLSEVTGELKDLLFLAVVVTLCVWSRGARLVAMCLAGGTAALAALSLVQQFVLGDSTDFFGLAGLPPNTDIGLAVPRHSGPYADSNFWGRQLVMAAPLALALFADRTRGARRWWWLAAFLAICGGVYLTGSRGTQLALGAVFVTWCLLSGRRYIRLLYVAPLLAALLLAVPGVGSRLVSLGDTSASGGTEQVDPSLEGRIAAQEMALLMVRDHPAIGVGAANFLNVEPEYQRRYGYNTPLLAPHNLYLEQAAEGGIIGLATWLAFFGAAIFVAARARLLLRPRSRGDEPPSGWYLAGGVIAALIGWGVAGAFLHMATFRVFLLVVAIGVGLDVRARQAAADRLGAPRWQPVMLAEATVPRPPRPPRLRLAAASSACALAVVCGGAYLVPGLLYTTRWQASAYVEVAPRRPYSSAYQLDVLSRQALMNTYLALLGAPRFQHEAERSVGMPAAERLRTTVTSHPEGTSSIFAVDVDAPTERGAWEVARHTRTAAGAFVDRAGSLYVFRGHPESDTVRPVRELRTSRAGAIAAFGLAFAGVAYVLIRRWDWFRGRA